METRNWRRDYAPACSHAFSLFHFFWGGGISTSSFLSIAKIFRFLPFYFVDFAQAFENVKRARQWRRWTLRNIFTLGTYSTEYYFVVKCPRVQSNSPKIESRANLNHHSPGWMLIQILWVSAHHPARTAIAAMRFTHFHGRIQLAFTDNSKGQSFYQWRGGFIRTSFPIQIFALQRIKGLNPANI